MKKRIFLVVFSISLFLITFLSIVSSTITDNKINQDNLLNLVKSDHISKSFIDKEIIRVLGESNLTKEQKNSIIRAFRKKLAIK
ncbi:hypothetical protein HYW75_03245 [Candidatus Pacearchaeota archaeon]|nr:hypothetical protein [Candidatus Pacearchaeota archaeon]